MRCISFEWTSDSICRVAVHSRYVVNRSFCDVIVIGIQGIKVFDLCVKPAFALDSIAIKAYNARNEVVVATVTSPNRVKPVGGLGERISCQDRRFPFLIHFRNVVPDGSAHGWWCSAGSVRTFCGGRRSLAPAHRVQVLKATSDPTHTVQSTGETIEQKEERIRPCFLLDCQNRKTRVDTPTHRGNGTNR